MVLQVLRSAGIVMFFVLLELLIFCFAAAQQIRNLTLPNIEHGTIHWHRFRKEKNSYFFCIQITTTVKKSNSAAEPHGSPLQGCCTVRPRKGAGQSSIGGGWQRGGVFSVSPQTLERSGNKQQEDNKKTRKQR
jgi:hypothetical protein